MHIFCLHKCKDLTINLNSRDLLIQNSRVNQITTTGVYSMSQHKLNTYKVYVCAMNKLKSRVLTLYSRCFV